jgi:hypothetical protein
VGLAEVYARWSHDVHGGDKGTAHDYLPTYERVMTRTTGVRLLEIGVCFGHSVGMWGEYLTDSEVHGIDTDLSRLWFTDLPNLHTADATDAAAVDAALGDLEFDYIIDDGSHALMDQSASLMILWPRLKSGGSYIIEDIDNDSYLAALHAQATAHGATCEVYDGREATGRWDEIMLIAVKP